MSQAILDERHGLLAYVAAQNPHVIHRLTRCNLLSENLDAVGVNPQFYSNILVSAAGTGHVSLLQREGQQLKSGLMETRDSTVACVQGFEGYRACAALKATFKSTHVKSLWLRVTELQRLLKVACRAGFVVSALGCRHSNA